MTLIDDMRATENIVRNDGVYRRLVCPKCGVDVFRFRGEYLCEGTYRGCCDFETQTLGDLAIGPGGRTK